MRRYIVPLLIGIVGAGVLIALGLWQLQRLDWKRGELARIDAHIGGTPGALPAVIAPRDLYLPVVLKGRFTGEGVQVLVSRKRVGAGHLQISVLETEGRRVLIDRGFRPVAVPDGDAPEGPVELVGNVYWPDVIDRFTPDPDPAQDLWFVRDVSAIAAHLGTEPVLVVVRTLSLSDAGVTPLPVDSSGVPNNHFEYAVTWFGLATVWLGMTALLLWRIRQKTV